MSNFGGTTSGDQKPPLPSDEKKGFAIAGMVLGILAVFVSLEIGGSAVILIGVTDLFLLLALGVTGLVLSRISLNKQLGNRYMAKAGYICSIVGLALALIFFTAAEIRKGEIKSEIEESFRKPFGGRFEGREYR